MTDMTIQSQLDQVLALSEKATPGPWGACNQDKGGCICGGVHSVSEDMGVAGTGSILEDLFCGNREEDADKIAANAVLIAQAVNFIREHGPSIRSAVGGEAVAAAWTTREQLKLLDNRRTKRASMWSARNKERGDIPLYIRRKDAADASPTATVGVGALARLVTRWNLQAAECESEARRMEGQSVANELMRDAAQYRQSAFQLAALIGEKA